MLAGLIVNAKINLAFIKPMFYTTIYINETKASAGLEEFIKVLAIIWLEPETPFTVAAEACTRGFLCLEFPFFSILVKKRIGAWSKPSRLSHDGHRALEGLGKVEPQIYNQSGGVEAFEVPEAHGCRDSAAGVGMATLIDLAHRQYSPFGPIGSTLPPMRGRFKVASSKRLFLACLRDYREIKLKSRLSERLRNLDLETRVKKRDQDLLSSCEVTGITRRLIVGEGQMSTLIRYMRMVL